MSIEQTTSSNTLTLYKIHMCIMDVRSSSHGLENPVELTDDTYAKEMIGKTPALIHNGIKCML